MRVRVSASRHRAADRGAAIFASGSNHFPCFCSGVCDLGYKAVGEIDSRHETLAALEQPNRTNAVYFDGERRPPGVLLWTVFGRVDAARQLIRAGQAIEARTLSETAG